MFTSVFLTATPGWAHNRLISSHPFDGASITSAPPSVTLIFAEELNPNTELTVTDAKGAPASGKALVIGSGASAPLTATQPGTYTVRYKTLSDDGDEITGSMKFTLLAPDAPTPSPSKSAAAAASPVAVTQDSSHEKMWMWIAVAELAVLIGVVSAFLLLRRRNAA